MIYTGIGSRETPSFYLYYFQYIAQILAINGFTLRSGAADGADMSFEKGCDIVNGKKEIYLPWSNFNNSTSNLVLSFNDTKAYQMAASFHPRWDYLKQGARKLHARNSLQLFGKDMNLASDFVLCWTKDGKGKGGTGQALRIARSYGIPVFDFGYSTPNNPHIIIDQFDEYIKNLKENDNGKEKR